MAKKTANIQDFEISAAASFMRPGQMSDDYLSTGTADDLDADEEEQTLGTSNVAGEEDDEEDAPAASSTTHAPDDAGDDDEDLPADEAEEEEFSYAPMVDDLLGKGVLALPEGRTIADYDDDEDGFQAVIADTVSARLQATIAELPDTAQRLLQLALQGGTEDDLQALLTLADGPDWEAADLSDEQVAKAVVEEAMRLKEPELTDAEIQEAIADLEDLGKLDKQAVKDQKYLVKHDAARQAAVEAQVAARQDAAEQEYQQSITTVRNYVSEVQSIAGLQITKEDREGFMAYLTVKDKQGKTQADHMNTPERRIQKEFLNYKNFNLGKLKREAITQATQEVRKNLGRYNAGRPTSNQGQRPQRPDAGLAEAQFMSPAQFMAGFQS